eukprot:3426063-Prymnesium_polylepis.2
MAVVRAARQRGARANHVRRALAHLARADRAQPAWQHLLDVASQREEERLSRGGRLPKARRQLWRATRRAAWRQRHA